MLVEKSFETNGVTLHYVEGPPSGVPLVMLHGITTRWQVFLPVMPGFLIRYHPFALDFRGHGKSSRDPDGYSHAKDVADVVSFLRERVKAPAVLVGWSLGAIVALTVAAEAPELVRALVLDDPPLAEFKKDRSDLDALQPFLRALVDIATMEGDEHGKRAAFAALTPGLDEVIIGFRYKHLSLFDPAGLKVVLEGQRYIGYDLESLLSAVKCPTLLIQGNAQLGSLLSHATVETAKSLLAHGTYVYLPAIGHGLQGAEPVKFVQIVSYFLESL